MEGSASITMSGGASPGNARATAPLYEPLRRLPSIETTLSGLASDMHLSFPAMGNPGPEAAAERDRPGRSASGHCRIYAASQYGPTSEDAMPLSKPANRELLHQRDITVRGYQRPDGLLDIEAHLTDTKSYSFPNEDRGEIPAGEPLQ